MAEYLPTRDLLEAGLSWRVGNGESISIWHDRWLHNLPSGRIQTPVSTLTHEAKVAALIDQQTGWWNFDLIHSPFSPLEAESISGLPLSIGRTPYRLVWTASKQGCFTVRGAYFLEKTRGSRNKEKVQTRELIKIYGSWFGL